MRKTITRLMISMAFSLICSICLGNNGLDSNGTTIIALANGATDDSLHNRHDHTWTTCTETVHHEEEGHYETQSTGHYEKRGHYETVYDGYNVYDVCIKCGREFKAYDFATNTWFTDHPNPKNGAVYSEEAVAFFDHLVDCGGTGSSYTARNEYINERIEWIEDGEVWVDDGNVTVWVVDKPAWDETYVLYSYCQDCGVYRGNTNDDDAIDSQDVIYVLYNTFFADAYPSNQSFDFNGDGSVDANDAIYLLYYTYFPQDYPLQ